MMYTYKTLESQLGLQAQTINKHFRKWDLERLPGRGDKSFLITEETRQEYFVKLAEHIIWMRSKNVGLRRSLFLDDPAYWHAFGQTPLQPNELKRFTVNNRYLKKPIVV